MTDLLTRLEQATEGSEELDVAIGREWYGYGPEDPLWHMMPFSRSLDAALTLVPDDAYYWCVRTEELGHSAHITAHLSATTKSGVVATPALALCIAALRARG